MTEQTTIREYRSRTGKWSARLIEHADGTYSYKADGCGGYMGAMSRADAIEAFTRREACGYFQPDANKTPMRLIVLSADVTR